MSMRMDNETYRIRVQDLLGKLKVNGDWDPETQRRLEELAVQPRKSRYFLRAVSDRSQDVQVHFYRLVLGRVRTKDAVADLERHIRQRFYEDREAIKQVISLLDDPASIYAIFRVIAHTGEGWLAGELIRLMLAHPPERLREPVREAIQSGDYLLQCLGIYLVGKSRHEDLLEVLTEFYRKPFGEKIDRLEKKSLDALREGAAVCPEGVILRWLRDGSSRVRLLGVEAAEQRLVEAAVPDLVRLFLVDSRTRVQAARALERLEEAGRVSFAPGSEGARGPLSIMSQAKPEPLAATLRDLLRDDSPTVRQIAAKLSRLAPVHADLLPQLSRLATEERLPAVQSAALETLSYLDRERFLAAMVDVMSAVRGTVQEEALAFARKLWDERLTPEERARAEAEIQAKRKAQEAALEKFAGTVEWWRHDM